jgi:hypothetical protein
MKKEKFTSICIVTILILMGVLAMTPTAISKPSKLIKSVINVPADYPTIQAAIDAANDGDKIMVAGGEWFGAIVTKAVEIKGKDNAIIIDGPAHPNPSYSTLHFGFKLGYGQGGNEATISHFTFECSPPSLQTDGLVFPIFSNDADDVTVHHCTFNNALQGITNWDGNGWYIHHNIFNGLHTFNGGGIGIFCGSYTGVTSNDNVISHNKITGTLQVSSGDGGGYDGSGIVLYADFRWGGAGASEITNNIISHNKICMVSDNPSVVDFNAIELTDSRDDPNEIIIFDNIIINNDMRGSANGILLTPANLGDYNTISKNKF